VPNLAVDVAQTRIKPREERTDVVMVMPTTATQVGLKTVIILQLNTRP
jgi:hypothetical protein